MKSKWDKTILLGLVVALIILIDQLTKYLASAYTGEIFFLSWYENHGISFGIELPDNIAVVSTIGFILILFYLFFSSHRYPFVYYLGLTLSLGGGISNLVDRLSFGFVRDFISISILPIFNLADVSIVVGVVLIIMGVLKHGRKSQKI